MRINYLGLLLEVESLLMILNLSLAHFAIVVLSVVREEHLGVWVSHKAVSAASVAHTFVTNWQLLD